jgi:hypothetical protein
VGVLQAKEIHAKKFQKHEHVFHYPEPNTLGSGKEVFSHSGHVFTQCLREFSGLGGSNCIYQIMPASSRKPLQVHIMRLR